MTGVLLVCGCGEAWTDEAELFKHVFGDECDRDEPAA